MTELVPCPLCGGASGYTLKNGSTYRWHYAYCASCGEVVAECCAGELRFEEEPPTTRTAEADTAWNEAGAYAEGLRVERDRLAELCRHVADRILRGDSDGELLKLLEEGYSRE